jgi:hypothetical protein
MLFFRHILATIADRGGKILRGAPESFPSFRAGETTRSPAQILAHMADFLEWALRLAEDRESEDPGLWPYISQFSPLRE